MAPSLDAKDRETTTLQLFGRRYDTGAFIRLEIAGGRIARLIPLDAPGGGDSQESWPWLAPGLLDIQLNGYGGQEFSSRDLTPAKAAAVVRAFEPFGVTRICPTFTTESFAVLQHAMRTMASLLDTEPAMARRIPGFHLEGPYITQEDGARGAHPKQHCRKPDWDEFQRLQETAGGRIRILTLAPELDGALPFISRVAATGVLVAIAHTAASPEQIHAGVDAGARLSTHLGNGSHPILHRLRNYIWAQLADDRLAASMIVDGHHLPPDVVRVFLRAKGPQRCILVSDISGQAGQPPGRYSSPFCEIETLPNGRLVVAGQREIMAGASVPLNAGVANVMRFADVDLATAIGMATENPARLLGLTPATLTPGAPADLIQFHWPCSAESSGIAGLQVQCTVIDGEVAWGQRWAPQADQA